MFQAGVSQFVVAVGVKRFQLLEGAHVPQALIREKSNSLRGNPFRRELFLNQLRHHALSCDEVGHRIHINADKRLADAIRQRRQPVYDHHRTLVEGGLNGRRSRRCDHDIARREHVVSTVANQDRSG